MVPGELRRRFEATGWVWLAGFYASGELDQLRRCVDELQNGVEQSCLSYYERPAHSTKVLSRIENFVSSARFPAWVLAPSSPLVATLRTLFDEEPVLFKDKLNVKPSSGGAFTVHQDAPAYRGFGVSRFITAMIAIDDATVENGCLEFASGPRVDRELRTDDAGRILQDELDALVFEPCLAQRGDVVAFDGLVPHRSAANRSDRPRRAIFLTFNARHEGDRLSAYFTAKQALFPPETERAAGTDYHAAGRQFNLGNPFV